MMTKADSTALIIFSAVTVQRFLTAFQAEIYSVASLDADSVEAVHRMRVAGRRLRNALELLGGTIAPKRALLWRKEIGRLTRALGEARDTDVLVLYLEQYLLDCPSFERPGIRRFILRLRQARAANLAKIHKALKSLDKSGVGAEILARTESLTPLEEFVNIQNPEVQTHAAQAINRRLDDFLANESAVGAVEDIAGLHYMRILAKHLRYTLEIYDPVYAGQLAPTIKVLRQMQDQLGAIHDYDVWVERINEFLQIEQERTATYFGSARPFKRLQPGLNAFSQHCQQRREETYLAFKADWEAWKSKMLWENLRSLIVPGETPDQPEHQEGEAE
jgi:CHAD domain-containing protein